MDWKFRIFFEKSLEHYFRQSEQRLQKCVHLTTIDLVCTVSKKQGHVKLKVYHIFHLVHISLIGFFCFHCKFLKAKEELSLSCWCEPSCSTLSVLNVMLSQRQADNLTNRINVLLLLSIENFNIWSSFSQEEIQTECIIIFKRVWRNVWKSENVIYYPQGSQK